MGGNSQKRAIEQNAATQRRIADEDIARSREQTQIAREDREFQRSLFEQIRPFAESLVGTFDPEEYSKLTRPDMSSLIRRQYGDEIAENMRNRNRALAESEDFYTAGGLGRSGMRGMSAGSIYAQGNRVAGDAYRRMQDRLSQEDLDAYYDARDRANERAQLGLSGVNVMAGQQGVFDPNVAYRGSTASSQAASSGLGQSSQGYYRSSQIPSGWSRAIGAATGLGMAALGNPSGLKNIWSGGR